jgi:hypothetical protein
MSSTSYQSSTTVDNFISDAAPPMQLPPPPQSQPFIKPKEEPVPNILPAATKAERFLLTAADQESGSRDERLNQVIRSKYEAGLLKPYNYVKGYARLSRWMDRKCVILPLVLFFRSEYFIRQCLSGIKAADITTPLCLTTQI